MRIARRRTPAARVPRESATFQGSLDGDGLKIAILLSRFNQIIGERLLGGALAALERRGVRPGDIAIVKVPGAFEIPLVARRLAATRRYDAVVCLGAVVRGETPHFDRVAGEASKGIARASFETGVPVLFGVLTVDNVDQAMERAGGKLGNKGSEAAEGAVEMANLLRLLPAKGGR